MYRPFSNIVNTLLNPLRGLNGAPDHSAMQRRERAMAWDEDRIQRPKIKVAAIRTTPKKPFLLEAKQFSTGSFVANEFSPIGYFKCPERTVFELNQGKPFRAYFFAVAEEAGTAAGAQTITAPSIVRTLRNAPAFPTTFHPDVAVFCRVAGVWQKATITAVNFATGVVTYTEPAATTAVECYYTHTDGEWRIRLQRELGSDTSATTLLNGTFGSLHLVNQNDSKTRFTWPVEARLVSGFRLVLEVNSSLKHVMGNKRAPHVLQIAATSFSIDPVDLKELRSTNEIATRGGI